jgi:hypothetical protein
MNPTYRIFVAALVGLGCLAPFGPAWGQAFNIEGVWVGQAQGPIFGAKGSVTISQQEGGVIRGIVEGGNFLGSARFSITGRIQGNRIVGQKQGNIFQGYIYQDGTIRGALRAVDGDVYQVFLRRPYQYYLPQNPGLGGYP